VTSYGVLTHLGRRQTYNLVMEWFRCWTVGLLCLLAMTMHRCCASPLTSIESDTANQREKRSTTINDESPWSPDYDNEVTRAQQVLR